MSADISQIPPFAVDDHAVMRKSIAARSCSHHNPLFRLILIVLIAACGCQWAAAQPLVPGGQPIIHQSWTFKEGAPESVEALAQTADGYLWLGTPSGLFRFDGARFELFQSPFGDQLPSTNISALFAPATGGLWVGYRFGGFSFLNNGKLTNFRLPSATATVHGFAQDRQGIIWAATWNGVWRFDGSSWQPNAAGWSPGLEASQVGFDRDGILWVLTEDKGVQFGRQLFYLLADGGTFQKAGDHLFTVGFTRDADDTVLTAHEKAPGEPSSGIALNGSLPAYPILKKNSDQIVDRSNGIWFIPRDPFILRHPAGEPLPEIVSKASPDNSLVYDISPLRYAKIVDREGSIWIGDRNGLHRFSYTPLIETQLPDRSGTYFTVAPDDGGVVWISTGHGNGSSSLYRISGGQTEFRGTQSGLATFAYRAPDKTLWFGGEGGLVQMVNGRFQEIRLPPEMADSAGALRTVTQDQSGGMWVSFGPAGLYRLKDGIWTKSGGRPNLTAGSLIAFTDHAGRIWFGFAANRIEMLDRDRVQAFGPADGLQVGNVTALYGRGPEIWVGGEFALEHFEQGRFRAIHSVDRESLRGISGIVETANGDLWLNGLGGIIHLRRAEILEALKNPAYEVHGERLGRREGLPGLPSQLGKMPTAIEGTDGRLWFTAYQGVVWLDPARASKKIPPPPVTIQSVSGDDRSYRLDQPPRFPAHTSSVQISYTAVSLSNPEAIRFRYKLRETDKDWHETATSNSVSYRNLPPGSYHFVVTASDTNGLWSDNSATAEFTVLPAFYQTNWFRALGALIVLALLWAAYQFRVRQLQRHVRQLQDVIETIPVMAWTALPDGSNTFVNRRWAEYTGLSAEETAGSSLAAAVHPEDRQAYSEKRGASLATGEPFETEARFRCAANGEYRWFLARGVPLRDQHGKILRWYGILTDIEDRKRAEETLRESETRFRTFLDNVGDAIFVYDFEQGTIFDVNPQACEGLGYTRQELVGTVPLFLHLDADRAAMESAAKRAAAGETVFDIHWHRRKDGTVFPVEVHTSLFWYGGRRFLLKVARDISDRLRAEEAVRQSEKQLRDVIDTIPAYVWSARPDGPLDFLNKRCLEFSGSSFEEQLGHGWEAVLHPEDRDRFLEESRAAIASGEPIETEARYRRADGQYRWLLVRGVPLRDEAGTIVKWYGANTDIDDRKRAEEALKRSEAYLADAQRLAHTGAWASDGTTQPLYWSKEVFRLFGFDPQQGLPAEEERLRRIHPDDLEKFKQAFDRAIHQKLDSEVEFRILLPDGTVKHVCAVGHPVSTPNGEVVEVVGTVVDITERKRAEEERERLRQLEADLAHIDRVSMMGELAASIAHEVNQPLTGIVSNGSACLRWLAGDEPNVEEAREAVRDIVRDGKRAGEVIARVRALTKRTAPPRARLDVNETIREVLAIIGDEAKRKSVVIRTQFADDLAPVSGDGVQLQQVVLNLVMNGMEAMSSVGERERQLVITTRNIDPDQVLVTVEDSGIGLEPNTMTRIFEPFFTTKSSGTGMGLSISRSILQNHGGRLWATANNGLGTSFHFTLPKDQGEEKNAGVAAV